MTPCAVKYVIHPVWKRLTAQCRVDSDLAFLEIAGFNQWLQASAQAAGSPTNLCTQATQIATVQSTRYPRYFQVNDQRHLLKQSLGYGKLWLKMAQVGRYPRGSFLLVCSGWMRYDLLINGYVLNDLSQYPGGLRDPFPSHCSYYCRALVQPYSCRTVTIGTSPARGLRPHPSSFGSPLGRQDYRALPLQRNNLLSALLFLCWDIKHTFSGHYLSVTIKRDDKICL